jgi:hypothetical protein
MIATEIELKINEIMAEEQSKFKKLLDGALTEQSKEFTRQLEKSQVEVEELKLELSKAKSENRKLTLELVRTNGAAWKEINPNSILNKIPTEAFDFILKYLYTEDDRKVSITCEKTYQRVQSSFYQKLKSKVDDWSIYQDIMVCKQDQEYLSLDYISTDFQIGERPKIEEDIIAGDSFELNDGAEAYDGGVEEDYLALSSPVDYFNTDLLINIDLRCTWLSVKTINLQHLTNLYLLY